MVVALESGAVETKIETARSAVSRASVTRRSVTGVSEFPDDAPGAVIPEPVDGFPVRRPAALLEALRDAADGAPKPASRRSFTCALGSCRSHRSTWMNSLAVGGLDAIGGDVDGAVSAADAVAAFEQAGASVAVLCSSDPVYAELAVPAARREGAQLIRGAADTRPTRDEHAAARRLLHAGRCHAALTDLHELQQRLLQAEKPDGRSSCSPMGSPRRGSNGDWWTFVGVCCTYRVRLTRSATEGSAS